MNDYRALNSPSFHDWTTIAANIRHHRRIAIGSAFIASAAFLYLAFLIYGLL